MRIARWLSLAVVATLAVSVSAILVDTDRDGSADLELLDTVGNGSFDTIVNLSQEFSGVEAPAKLLDLDQDGRHDLKLIDTDADGIHDTIVELETEADIAQSPETSNFKIKPVILPAPGSAPEADAPVFHPFGSLAKKTRKSNKFTVVLDPSAPAQPVNKCRCTRRKPKEYVGAEIYPDAPPAPAVSCGCNKAAPVAAPQHIAPRYYKAAPAPAPQAAAAVAPAKPAAPAPVFVAPEFHPEPVQAPAPPQPAAAAKPAPPALVAPEYYP